MDGQAWYEEVAIPALLRAARAAYSRAVREALVDAGFEDVPRNGFFVLAGTTKDGASVAQVIEELRVSKQAASQLIDILVGRGYLDRAPDPADRRRLTVKLTHRGVAAASAVRTGVDRVDSELADRVSTADRAALRAGLAALAEIAGRTAGTVTPRREP